MESSINKDIITHIDHVIEDCYRLLKSTGEKHADIVTSILKEASLLRTELLSRLRRDKTESASGNINHRLNYRLMELYGRLNGV